MTSRSLSDIQAMLSIAPHVKAVSLDDVPVAFTECDIHLHLLKGLEDIGKREVSQIAQKADGLFVWASLACEYIRLDTTGESVKERFSNATVCIKRGEVSSGQHVPQNSGEHCKQGANCSGRFLLHDAASSVHTGATSNQWTGCNVLTFLPQGQ